MSDGVTDAYREWAERKLPFLWDICKDLEDGSEWVCIPHRTAFDEQISLLSRSLKEGGEERIVETDNFTKKYKVINTKGEDVYEYM